MKIIKYRNYNDIDVEFLDDYHFVKEHQIYVNFKNGSIKNPYDKTMGNVGYIGVGKYKLHNKDLSNTPAYEAWTCMLMRCYIRKEFHWYPPEKVCVIKAAARQSYAAAFMSQVNQKY